MTDMALMLFAAGFGTSMRPLTNEKPKPLIRVAGTPLIDHALKLAETATIGRIVVNLHYRADMLEAHLAHRAVVTIREEPEILNTGGGLKNALPLLGSEPVVTMNSDAIWSGPNPITLLQDAWEPETMDALLICVPIAQTRAYTRAGDFDIDPHGQLTRGQNHVYGGVQILHTDGLSEIDETSFSLNVLWNRMAERGRLFGLRYPGVWCDVGHPEGIAAAEAVLSDV